MKKFLLIFCSVILVSVVTVLAYNSGKGPAKLKDGIAELPQQENDSLFVRGKHLMSEMNYSEQDLEAIAVYLKNR